MLAETTAFFTEEAENKYPSEFEEALDSLPKLLRKKISKPKKSEGGTQ